MRWSYRFLPFLLVIQDSQHHEAREAVGGSLCVAFRALLAPVRGREAGGNETEAVIVINDVGRRSYLRWSVLFVRCYRASPRQRRRMTWTFATILSRCCAATFNVLPPRTLKRPPPKQPIGNQRASRVTKATTLPTPGCAATFVWLPPRRLIQPWPASPINPAPSRRGNSTKMLMRLCATSPAELPLILRHQAKTRRN